MSEVREAFDAVVASDRAVRDDLPPDAAGRVSALADEALRLACDAYDLDLEEVQAVATEEALYITRELLNIAPCARPCEPHLLLLVGAFAGAALTGLRAGLVISDKRAARSE